MDTDTVKPITTIIFDWAGIFCTPGEPFTHPSLPAQTGLTVDEMGLQTKELQEAYYRGRISTEEFWMAVIEKFKLSGLTPEDLGAAYCASYSLYPGMLEFANSLRANHKIILLSNLTDIMMRHITSTHHIEKYFDLLVFSNQIGFMKPEALAYQSALAKAGVQPEETLFIDDSQKNVSAARALGMSAFQFEGGKTDLLKSHLEKAGVTLP